MRIRGKLFRIGVKQHFSFDIFWLFGKRMACFPENICGWWKMENRVEKTKMRCIAFVQEIKKSEKEKERENGEGGGRWPENIARKTWFRRLQKKNPLDRMSHIIFYELFIKIPSFSTLSATSTRTQYIIVSIRMEKFSLIF